MASEHMEYTRIGGHLSFLLFDSRASVQEDTILPELERNMDLDINQGKINGVPNKCCASDI